MQKLEVRRLGYALGAEVAGLDLTQPLDDDTVAAIRAAWLEHVLLCFPQQHLGPDELAAFCSRFGELDDNRSVPRMRHPDQPFVVVMVSKTIAIREQSYVGNLSDHWHTDLSYTDRPTTASFLHAVELPDAGGDTMFANTYLAYESLSPAFRQLIAPLEGVHDLSLGEGFKRYNAERQAELLKDNPPTIHPVVRTHSETGRKALYAGSRVRSFLGMTPEETKPLLDFLNRHATRYEFTYRHRWRIGDLLMWDNRCSLHTAVGNYDKRQQRRLQRCSLVGPKSGYAFTSS